MYQPDFPDMPASFGVEIARAARLVDVAATSPMIDRCTSASLRAFVLRLVTSAGVSVACTMMPYQDCVSALPSRSEEHTSELQSLMRISYAALCLKKKKIRNTHSETRQNH